MDYDTKRLGVLKLVLEDIVVQFTSKLELCKYKIKEADSFKSLLPEEKGPYYLVIKESEAVKEGTERKYLFFKKAKPKKVKQEELVLAVSQKIEYGIETGSMFLHVYSRDQLNKEQKEYLKQYACEFGIQSLSFNRLM